MIKLCEVKRELNRQKPMLARRYGVKQIGIFGSYIRGKARPKSDLDLLVDFSRPISLISFVQLRNNLSDQLGVNVDLVMKRALKPGIGKSVLKEVSYV